MLGRLILFFTITPVLELAILIPLAQNIGIMETIAIIIFTGVGGAWLARQQGWAAWRRILEDLTENKVPKDSLLDGLAVLIAGAFMITPGVLTDVAGVCLLVPFLREPFKKYLKNKIQKKIEDGTASFTFKTYSSSGSYPPDQDEAASRRDEIVSKQFGDPSVIDVTEAAEQNESDDDSR